MCVMYTATEDCMNVLIVGRCLRQTLKCVFMYVFTLVQSHTHVDTVQTVLCGLTNWSDIYWSHTMKALGSPLTCNICQKKFSFSRDFKVHVRRHEGVKPYVCSECPKCFCTAQELKLHQLVHSDVRNFACGFCAKSFKRKQDVLRHFKRRACDPVELF